MHENKRKDNLVQAINLMIAVFAFFALFWMMFDRSENSLSANGLNAFRYFTVDSNVLMAVTAVLSLIERTPRIKKSGLLPPRFMHALRIAAVSSVIVTFAVTLFYLAPAVGFLKLYANSNFFFHFVIPALSLTVFCLTKKTEKLPFGYSFFSLIPVSLYAVYYSVPVIVHMIKGTDYTSEHDWYGIYSGAVYMLPLIIVFTFVTGMLLLKLANRQAENTAPHKKKSGKNRKNVPGQDALERGNVSANEYYLTKVLGLLCIIAASVGVFAGGCFTFLTLTGNYDMSTVSLIVFDAFCVSYSFVALYLFRTCISENGIVRPEKVRFGKIVLSVIIVLQWNLISYLCPFRSFWAYSVLFILLCAMFLDSRLVLTNEFLIFSSMILSWLIGDSRLLPDRNSNFFSELFFRIVSVALSFFIIYIISKLVADYLLDTLDRFSDYDVLTRTLNRRRLNRTIENAIYKYRYTGAPFCVAIFDLDDFKKVNDNYGHMNGDKVLRRFSNIMLATVKSRDFVFRYGGEEFLILFDCEEKWAYMSCTKILRELQKHDFDFFRNGEHVTATAGLSVYEDGMTAEAVMIDADDKLLSGKRSGKNRVVK